MKNSQIGESMHSLEKCCSSRSSLGARPSDETAVGIAEIHCYKMAHTAGRYQDGRIGMDAHARTGNGDVLRDAVCDLAHISRAW